MARVPSIDRIQHGLTREGNLKLKVHAFAELPSTSVWLRDSIDTLYAEKNLGGDELGHHHLCVTDWQSSGIARRGRQWETKPGNITFSLLSLTNAPISQLMGLSLVTGIGVTEALGKELGLKAQLKWPNDVLVSEHKLGGLLTEIKRVGNDSQTLETRNAILTGIGINFLHDDDVVPLGIGATSLQGEGIDVSEIDRDELIGDIARSVIKSHALFLKQGWSPFSQQWETVDFLRNKQISIDGDAVSGSARVLGVNNEGALIIEQNGKTIPLYSGNVSVRPT